MLLFPPELVSSVCQGTDAKHAPKPISRRLLKYYSSVLGFRRTFVVWLASGVVLLGTRHFSETGRATPPTLGHDGEYINLGSLDVVV